jgi:hypothetical protein
MEYKQALREYQKTADKRGKKILANLNREMPLKPLHRPIETVIH